MSRRSATDRVRTTFWQRRYVLAHYGELDDEVLAAQTRLTPREVSAVLAAAGASRSPGQAKRMQREADETTPAMFTPRRAWAALTHLDVRPLDRRDYALVIAMFLGSLALYATTAARTVTGEDAGELLAAAHGLGVPHPPGYPLWTLLGFAADRALDAIGIGTVAWRITMVSAVFAAAANAILLLVALGTLASRIAACTAVGLFAVSLTHWSQAVIPEVYGLNTFFVALGVWLLLRIRIAPSPSRIVALFLVLGLSLTNHTTALPVALLLGVAAIAVAPRTFTKPTVIVGALLAVLLPLGLYGYLPWASLQDPYLDWGNPETVQSTLDHVLRTQYIPVEAEQATAAPSLGERFEDYVRRLGILGGAAARQFATPWLLLFAVLGFFVLAVRQTGLWLVLVSIGLLCSVAIVRYTQFSFDREHVYANQIFFIPAWLAVAWLLGGGVDEVLRWVRGDDAPVGSGISPPRPAARAHAVAAALAVALIAYPASSHYAHVDRSRTTLIADFGRSILDVMEPGALYFPSSDHSTFSVLYWQGVHGHRPDVVIADRYGRIERDVIEPFLDAKEHEVLSSTSGEDARRFLESVLIRKWPGPVYLSNRRDMSDLPDLSLQPCGPIFRVMTQAESDAWWAAEGADTDPRGITVWDSLDFDLDDPREGLDFTVQMVRGDLRYLHGFALMRAGRLDDAIEIWDRIEGDLAPLKQICNNVGSALAEHGRPVEARTFYRRALGEDPEYGLALRNQALVTRDAGDVVGAVALLDVLIEHDPHEGVGRLLRARLLGQLGRVAEALADYEELTHHDPDDPDPWREAGELMVRVGDTQRAETLLEESLARAPDDRHAQQLLAHVRSGALWFGAAPGGSAGGSGIAASDLTGVGTTATPVGFEAPSTQVDPFAPPALDTLSRSDGSIATPPPGVMAPALPDPTAGLVPRIDVPDFGAAAPAPPDVDGGHR